MKKCISLLLVLVFASFTTSNELIPISGKITNTEKGTITIKGESFNQTIKLNSDGSFTENITITYDGIYSLESGKNSIPIYLSKGTKLNIIANDPELIKNLTAFYNNAKAVEIGQPSPKFNYENQKGGKTSLESLKGKYVYIDVWATWCGPCIKEIPSLQKVEEQYKDKNIVFVSLSVDAEKDHDKWRRFVTEKKLGGIQLLADKEFNSAFIQVYGITGIPRFILIGPNGNIVNSQAPRPSETALIDLFNALKI